MEYDREKLLTMRDVRAAKQCSRGARLFCEYHHIDWQDFLKNGIKCGILMDLNDAMVMETVRACHGR
jgi:hypothetical protein